VSFYSQYRGSRDDRSKYGGNILRHFVCGVYLPMKLCVLRLAIFVALSAAAHSALADAGPKDDDLDAAIKPLCTTKDTEGSYDWKLDGAPARLWVICQSQTRILASINIPDAFYTLTMVHIAINRRNSDILSFATYDLSPEGAMIVNGRTKSHAVLRLSIRALRQGMAVGEFQRNPILPIPIDVTRTKPLPSLLAQTSSAQAPSFQFSGSFYIEQPSDEEGRQAFQRVKIKPPACMAIAIDGNLRTVNFHDSGNLAMWLPWGSPADSGGNVFYATNGVDDALAGKDSITQIRGTFLAANLIEFFYFNSLIGLAGPFRAIRMDDQALASNPCRPNMRAVGAADTGTGTRRNGSRSKRTTPADSIGRAMEVMPMTRPNVP